jgi:hypothetical protein
MEHWNSHEDQPWNPRRSPVQSPSLYARQSLREPAVSGALFEILETQKLLASDARLTLLQGQSAQPRAREFVGGWEEGVARLCF